MGIVQTNGTEISMSDEDSPTPTTLPGKPKRAQSSNGVHDDAVPAYVPFENTGEVANKLFAAVEGSPGSAEDFLESLARKLVAHGGGGGGDAPAKHAKSIKRHNWLAVVMAALLGPGGAIAVIYATSDRAKSNTQEVEHLKEATKAVAPRVEKNQEQIRLIQVDVSGINKSMGDVKTSQSEIASGIEELKKENVTRLKNELDDANRELRRMRRDDDR